MSNNKPKQPKPNNNRDMGKVAQKLRLNLLRRKQKTKLILKGTDENKQD